MRRIGILGGTFDPVHNGHLLLGEQAYREYGLDEIWFMPSHVPPHKKDHLITDGAARIRMLELATESIPYFTVSDFEMGRLCFWYPEEPTRTVVCRLRIRSLTSMRSTTRTSGSFIIRRSTWRRRISGKRRQKAGIFQKTCRRLWRSISERLACIWQNSLPDIPVS